ncbi:MAG: hypothetical protein ACI9BH_003093, partial [Paracoccaceae bacterium]
WHVSKANSHGIVGETKVVSIQMDFAAAIKACQYKTRNGGQDDTTADIYP